MQQINRRKITKVEYKDLNYDNYNSIPSLLSRTPMTDLCFSDSMFKSVSRKVYFEIDCYVQTTSSIFSNSTPTTTGENKPLTLKIDQDTSSSICLLDLLRTFPTFTKDSFISLTCYSKVQFEKGGYPRFVINSIDESVMLSILDNQHNFVISLFGGLNLNPGTDCFVLRKTV